MVRVVPSGSHVPQIPKILLLGTNLLPSRCVHGANRVPRSFAKWNCCTAEFSECLEVSTLSRFTFFWKRCRTFTCLHFPFSRRNLGGPILFSSFYTIRPCFFLVEWLGSVEHGGTCHQHAADWRGMPGIVHRGLHVVLLFVR